jgi:hypothetical protein
VSHDVSQPYGPPRSVTGIALPLYDKVGEASKKSIRNISTSITINRTQNTQDVPCVLNMNAVKTEQEHVHFTLWIIEGF